MFAATLPTTVEQRAATEAADVARAPEGQTDAG